MLPEVKQSSEIYGETCTTLFSTKSQLQVSQEINRQHFGQLCTKPGMVKTPTEPVVLCYEYWRQTCLF
jgi:glycerol kinase